MIKATALNNKEFFINSDLIEKLESTPDTVITLTNEKKFVVKESPEELINRIIEFRKKIYTKLPDVAYK